MLARWFRPRTSDAPRDTTRALPVAELASVVADAESPCGVDCVAACRLAECARGGRAVVVRVACDAADACRLRALGVYEGARVDVVDSRNGLLLQVRGSRIAL